MAHLLLRLPRAGRAEHHDIEEGDKEEAEEEGGRTDGRTPTATTTTAARTTTDEADTDTDGRGPRQPAERLRGCFEVVQKARQFSSEPSGNQLEANVHKFVVDRPRCRRLSERGSPKLSFHVSFW